MAISYAVKQGDCISSIAFAHGFFADTIWDHPANAELKQKRQDPNVLLPGDTVIIPEKRLKEELAKTGQANYYRLKGVPERLRLQLLIDSKPRKNEPYQLDIDGRLFDGTTDAEGRLQHFIPPTARKGRLLLQKGAEVMDLKLGHLDPIDTTSGLQGRLLHLGFYAGQVDGTLSPSTRHALQEFQESVDLDPSGEPDAVTLAALVRAYGE